MSEAPQNEAPQPAFGIELIYLKDLSLELPNAPQVFQERSAPQIDIKFHTEVQALGDSRYEVVLTVTTTAKLQEKTVFLVEVAQAGVFQIQNLPEQEMGPMLSVHCPKILLPYAREAVANTITRAGFMPVLLPHVGFETLYQQRLEQMRQQQAGAPAAH
jgi:preprotein translocase subunit SecB